MSDMSSSTLLYQSHKDWTFLRFIILDNFIALRKKIYKYSIFIYM